MGERGERGREGMGIGVSRWAKGTTKRGKKVGRDKEERENLYKETRKERNKRKGDCMKGHDIKIKEEEKRCDGKWNRKVR